MLEDDWQSSEVHPAATLFPKLEGKEFEALKEDIKLRGIRQPILRQGDIILDGRNRMAVAQELGLKESEIPYEEYEGTDAVGEIIANNILRRHLTDDQRVAIVAKIRGPEIAEKAAQRRSANLLRRKGNNQKVENGFLARGSTARAVASEADTSKHKAEAALAAAKYAPEDLDRVIAGKAKLAAARKAAELKKNSGKITKPKPAKPLEERVRAKFIRFMDAFPITEHREVKEVLRQILRVAD